MQDQTQLRHRSRGVTLIELMIVVVVVGILGVIAVPSYRAYVQRAQRVDATSTLLRVAANQERFYLQNNTYTNNLAAVGVDATGITDKGLYAIDIPVANAATFTVRAQPAGGSPMAADGDCQTFTLTAQGVRGTAPQPVDDCWQ
jgi:type IV pilus assembly protein PilE